MMTAAEAKSLGGIARQVRALLNGIDKLPEAFDEVEGLEGRRDAAKREHRAVEADITASRAAVASLDQDYEVLRQQYATLDSEHRSKKDQLEATLSTTRAELAAMENLKRETEAHLAAFAAKWNVTHG